MRAIMEETHGAPEVLRVSEQPIPEPAPGQVLIRVRAAGVNRADALQRRGYYPPPPGVSSIYGLEAAGTVVAVGAGVSPQMVGSPVAALLAGGGYAEYVAVDARHTFGVPEGMSFAEAACLPEVAATVYSNLVLTCGMSLDAAAHRASGTSVLIHGGAGGIGLHAVQLAKAVGARVFATVGTGAKADSVRAAGAEPIIYSELSFREVIAEKTGGVGVNYILDVVGGAYLDDNLHSLATGGHLAIIGLQGGAKAQANLGLMLTRRLSVHATSLRTRSADEKARIMAGVRQQVLPLVESGAIRANLDRTFALEQAARAHTYFDSGEHRGKIVLTLGED